jgi:predicted MPP superfamily phosphohydrolase
MSEVVNGFVIFIAVLGHLAIVRALINRGYELGLPQRVWQGLVILLIAAAVAGPILIVRFVGLRSGGWNEVPVAWVMYFGVCVVALVIGVVVLVLRSRDAKIPAQIAKKSEVYNYAERMPQSSSSNGAVAALARLPGNQIYSVEIVQRELRIGRLPPQWDGISILHITDLHMNGTPDRRFFEWATDRCAELKCDIAAMTGDVMDSLDVIDWLPTTLGKLDAPLGRYFVLGNHDLHAGGEQMRAAMEKIGWTSVAGRVVTKQVRDARLVIGGSESPWAGEHPPMDDLTSRRPIAQRQAARPGAALWAAEKGTAPSEEAAPGDFRILLSHAPHLIHWARERNIDLVLAGHLHGGQIQWPIIGPIAGGRFHSGLFDLPPTLMHVGRGLGQMAPIRWGCRPEITKLVLRAATRSNRLSS